MNTENVSYSDVISELKKHHRRGLLLSTGVAVTFMIIVFFVREGNFDLVFCGFAGVLFLVPLFGSVIPRLQMNSKLKKIQQKLNAETDADMDALLTNSTRIHPLCFLTDTYFISFQMMLVCDLQEIRCIQKNGPGDDGYYTVHVKCGGLIMDYLNYRNEAERDEAFRVLMNAVSPECRVMDGLQTIR